MQKPSLPTVKRLFTMSGNRCAFPDCSTPIIDPQSGSIVAQVCHIKGEKRTAARFDEKQNPAERHGFDNLILLCGRHHKVIDDDANTYTVEILTCMKLGHEKGATRMKELDDASANSLANTVSYNITQGSVITTTNQSGGQNAHSIVNNYGPAPLPTIALDRKLQSCNLFDPDDVKFGNTKYSQSLGLQDRNGHLHRWGNACILFAFSPQKLFDYRSESKLLQWMNANERRYEPDKGYLFIPSLDPEKVGKSLVWHDGHRVSLPGPSPCYLHYVAVEPDGFVEFGFIPGSVMDDEHRHFYYAKIVGLTVMFLSFIRDLARECKVDPASISSGVALSGTTMAPLTCISEGLRTGAIPTSPPSKNGFLYVHPAQADADWSIDEIAHEAAASILDNWAYRVSAYLGLPEFADGEYKGPYFIAKRGHW